MSWIQLVNSCQNHVSKLLGDLGEISRAESVKKVLSCSIVVMSLFPVESVDTDHEP